MKWHFNFIKIILTICSFKATYYLMETVERIIKEYISRDGKNHFRRWFDSLKDIRAQAKVDVRIGRLRLAISETQRGLAMVCMN